MEHIGKKKNPYKSLWLSSLILFLIPWIPFFIIYFAFQIYSRETQEAILWTSIAFGFGCGSLFHLSCILAGLLKDDFRIVVKRIATYFSNLPYSKKMAGMIYKEDIKENGITFWPHFLIILSYLGLTIYGVIKMIIYYGII